MRKYFSTSGGRQLSEDEEVYKNHQELNLQSLSKISTMTDRKSKLQINRLDLGQAMMKYSSILENQGMKSNASFLISVSKIINVKIHSMKQQVEQLYNSFDTKNLINQQQKSQQIQIKSNRKKKANPSNQKQLDKFFNSTQSTVDALSKSNTSSAQKQRYQVQREQAGSSLQKSININNIIDQSLRSMSAQKLNTDYQSLMNKQDSNQIEEKFGEVFDNQQKPNIYIENIQNMNDIGYQDQQQILELNDENNIYDGLELNNNQLQNKLSKSYSKFQKAINFIKLKKKKNEPNTKLRLLAFAKVQLDKKTLLDNRSSIEINSNILEEQKKNFFMKNVQNNKNVQQQQVLDDQFINQQVIDKFSNKFLPQKIRDINLRIAQNIDDYQINIDMMLNNDLLTLNHDDQKYKSMIEQEQLQDDNLLNNDVIYDFNDENQKEQIEINHEEFEQQQNKDFNNQEQIQNQLKENKQISFNSLQKNLQMDKCNLFMNLLQLQQNKQINLVQKEFQFGTILIKSKV